MSVVHMVKAQGKTKKELIKALQAAIAELTGDEATVAHVVQLSKVEVDEEEESEYEEVKSPFTKTAPALTTVIDNEVDNEGIPWDGRIHSSSKAKYKNDGTWKLARGVSDEQAAPIKQELRARVAASRPTLNIPAATFQTAPVVEIVTPVVQAAPVITPTAPAIPQMQSGHSVDTFKSNFALIIAQLITQGKINQDYVNQLKTHFGVAEIWMANEEQKAQVFDLFVQHGLVQKVG